MMLKNLLPRIEQRYALAGSAFGAFLPVICMAVDAFVLERRHIGLFGFSTPLALALMPLVFGFALYRIGRSRALLLDELDRHRKSERQMAHDAYHDRLTGLANRSCLERDMQAALRTSDNGDGTALLLLDLDRFKFVNDNLGHDAGDALLAGISDRLRRALSAAGRVYRIGGDEFVVTVPGRPSGGRIEAVCRTICALFDEPFDVKRSRVTSGCSIGVTFLQAGDTAVAQLLKRADVALYEAKEVSGNSFRLFDAALAADVEARAAMERDLARAMAAGEFFLEYQPIVGLESRAPRAFEALLRWRHPEKGVVSPERFVPAARKAGLILPLGEWVLREACREAAKWPAPVGVAVNVFADQFKDRAFVGCVRQCLAETELSPGRLTIEVSEAAFSAADATLCESLRDLRGHGVCVALDDFGIGGVSISNLGALPVDRLKIDRAFARMMTENAREAELVEIILRLGRTFQMTTAIDGIETESQLDFVRQRGACEVQGDLIALPVPAFEVPRFLASPERRLYA